MVASFEARVLANCSGSKAAEGGVTAPGNSLPRWGLMKDQAWGARNLPLSDGKWGGNVTCVEEPDSYVCGTCVCVCV